MSVASTMRRLVVSGLALALAALPAAAQEKRYGPGVSDTEIRIGNTSPYSGPLSSVGTVGRSIAAYLAMVNEQGGINGRKIVFLSYDDGYSPPKAVEQTRRLVEQDGVLAILGPVGTAPNTAIHKYLNAKGVPHLFVASGATKWGDPKNYPWTMGIQVSYQAEAAMYARYILRERPGARIAILYQNDDYGRDYLAGFKDALGAQAARMIVAEASYEPTDPTVDSQVIALKASGADTFFNVTTPKFAAQAIRKAAEIDWRPLHFLNNVGASVSAALQPAGLDKSMGVITISYIKDPTDPQWRDDPGYRDWLAWMRRYYPDGSTADFFNAFGYTIAQAFVQVIRQCGDELTRENVMRQAASLKDLALPMALPGVLINTAPDDYFPFAQARLARFDGEKWALFGELLSE